MNNPEVKKTNSIYFPNLDAARFLAAFAVFLLHFSNEIKALFPSISERTLFKITYVFTSKGSLGVNFFFVLSGFLITFLILNERKKRGYFNLGKFLVRRTLRIWPLYFIIGLIGFVLFPAIFTDYHTAHEALNYFFFLANFDEIWHGANDSINFLTSPWSVAVEEQFYLFWGILLFIFFKINTNTAETNKSVFRIQYIIVLLYLLSFYFHWINWTNEKIIYHHTLAVCQDILMGSFIGISLFEGKKWLSKIQEIPKIGVIIIYAVGIALCLSKNKIFDGQAIIIERFVLSLFFAFIILDQIRGSNSLFKLGRVRLFNYLGKISYGIYMYHLVVMYLLLRYIEFETLSMYTSIPIFFALSIGLTFLISAISYRYIESKFLSLKPQ